MGQTRLVFDFGGGYLRAPGSLTPQAKIRRPSLKVHQVRILHHTLCLFTIHTWALQWARCFVHSLVSPSLQPFRPHGSGSIVRKSPIRRSLVHRSATLLAVSISPPPPPPSSSPPLPPPLLHPPPLPLPGLSSSVTICRRGINITWSVWRFVSPPANYQFFIVADVCKGYRADPLSSISSTSKQRWTAGYDQRGGRERGMER